MKTTIFVHTNKKQSIGLVLAEYSFRKMTAHRDDVDVRPIIVEDQPAFQQFVGKTYMRKGAKVTYTYDDLQSFTLSRFMPPELMNYEGRAIVIDPDIFALQNIDELLDMDMQGRAIACCRKKDAWDTSMMMMDCSKLTHWKIADILSGLENGSLDYHRVMTLMDEDESTILEVPRRWNSLDVINPDTAILHTTDRLTQPWKTGLKIDFTRNKTKPILGFIPREPILFLRGKYPMTYQPHPDKAIDDWFFDFIRGAVADGAVTDQMVQDEIDKKNVRPDMLQIIHEQQ